MLVGLQVTVLVDSPFVCILVTLRQIVNLPCQVVGALSIVVRICIVAVFIEHVDVHVRAVWYVEVPIFAVSDGGSVAIIHQLSVGHRCAVESADMHVPLHVV